jgi:hypothetical protein
VPASKPTGMEKENGMGLSVIQFSYKERLAIALYIKATPVFFVLLNTVFRYLRYVIKFMLRDGG